MNKIITFFVLSIFSNFVFSDWTCNEQSIQNGYIPETSTSEEIEVEPICNEDHSFSFGGYTCMQTPNPESGIWIGSGQCQPSGTCYFVAFGLDYVIGVNGSYNGLFFPEGSTLNLSCKSNEELIAALQYTCTGGKWLNDGNEVFQPWCVKNPLNFDSLYQGSIHHRQL